MPTTEQTSSRDAALLEAWDAGRDGTAWEGGLCLLAAEEPEFDPATLDVGRAETRLLAARRRLFGEVLEATAACPECGETMELRLESAALESSSAAAMPASLELGEWRVRYRAPSAAAAARAARCGEEDEAYRVLLGDAVESAWEGERAVGPDELPPPVLAALEDALESAGSGAERTVRTTCPGCGEACAIEWDAASFVMRELGAWAARTLREVDELARRYGWSEAEILGLGARRRRAYLELAEG